MATLCGLFLLGGSRSLDRNETIAGDWPGANLRKLMSNAVAVVSLAHALEQGPPPPGNLAVPIHSHGTLAVELYTPKGRDPQKPHTRDEIYFVVRGRGVFFDGAERKPVEPGAYIFVPAGAPHRFEDFSEDFAVWVAFYGPEGGEKG